MSQSYASFNLDELIEGDDRFSTPLFPWQEVYPGLSRKPLRLSYSSFGLLNSCPRKFNLLKNKNLSEYEIQRESRENNVHLDFGSALGLGIQHQILTGNLKSSIFSALRVYNFAMETDAKNSLSIVSSLQAFEEEWPADEWKIVSYRGKPAAELSFKLILDRDSEDYYCGYMDVIIRHKVEKVAVIVEVKTTGLKLEDLRPVYANSSQGIGYSIILDAIEEEALEGIDASWTVLYIVVQFTGQNIIPKIHLLPFPKQSKDRFEWLLNTRIKYEQLLTYITMDYWPKHGSSCLSYAKPCPLFGLCDLEQIGEGDDAPIAKEEDWDFVFYLDELIDKEMKRTN